MSGDRISISGGDQRGAAFGIGSVVQHNHAAAPVSLDDIRAAVARHADAIVARGEGPEIQAALREGVDATARELAKPQPDGRIVKARWGSVLALVGGLIAANADAAQIWQFILDHFGR